MKQSFPLVYFYFSVCVVCVHACVLEATMACQCRSVDNFQELVLSFSHLSYPAHLHGPLLAEPSLWPQTVLFICTHFLLFFIITFGDSCPCISVAQVFPLSFCHLYSLPRFHCSLLKSLINRVFPGFYP